MLMLIIQPCYSSLDNQAYFNTSHVNVNHLKKVTFTVVKVYFNTSHVNVNQQRLNNCRINNQISIHLMLMLILIAFLVTIIILNFNTSHVNVNPRARLDSGRHRKHFNTSHVNVNQRLDKEI